MQADHDKALQSVFEKFAATELTINKPKCEFSKHSHILRQRNLTWSEESTSNSEYQSAHVDKWCPKFPGNGDVLRKVYSEFQWSVATTTGAHKERCPVQVDCWTQSSFCSPFGLSAILFQKCPGQDDRKVVAYASRSLSDVESRYSQTEKEALGQFKDEDISTCTQIVNLFNWSSTMRGRNLQHVSSDGTYDYKVTISLLYTPKEAKILQIFCPCIQV